MSIPFPVKKKVSKGYSKSKSGNMTNFGEVSLNIRAYTSQIYDKTKSPERLPLAYHTRCKCYLGASQN